MWLRFAVALVASGIAMYLLAFSEIVRVADFHFSLSTFWITLMMVSAMGIIMLVAMWPMFDGPARFVVLGGAALLLVASFTAARTQIGVDDPAFLRSMIPHHSRAVLVCEESDLDDPRVMDLCRRIIESQEQEIREMNGLLDGEVR